MDFFFDNQIRRYLLQFMRIFSNIKVRNGPDANGLYSIERVPIMYGDPSWLVAQLIKGASENTILPNPMFSAYIDSIKLSPDRRQDTQYVGKVSTIERQYNRETRTYSDGPGIRQDVERYMPVPYDLFLKLDVWTPNITIKLQLFEQISIIFNPSIQLQQNSNILDWTSIFEVWLEDFTFTNRSIPQGSDDTRDVMSFKFKVPIWINPPAKLKRSGLIAEIVTNVFNTPNVSTISGIVSDETSFDPFRTCVGGQPVQIVTTEGNYKISVSRGSNGDEITLLNRQGREDDNIEWDSLIKKYGQIVEDISKIRLKLDPNLDVSDSDIIGTIIADPGRKNVLLFSPDIDTLPANTISPIADIIDPTSVWPGKGLPSALPGQRYLLTSANSAGEEAAIPAGVNTSPWGSNIVAYPDDIIEYNGITWNVIFSAKNSTGINYVMNNADSSQYRYDSETKEWSYTYYGVYNPGAWRIDNIIPT